MNIGQVWRVRRGVEAVGSPTRVAKPGRDGDVGLTRVPLPARTERELHLRSDVGSSTWGRLPACTERSFVDGLTRGRARGIVYPRARRESFIDGLTRGEGRGESYPRVRRETASTV
ncbi:hypothetical protein F2Q69_00055186 [Brassica cretica]|uniref:Uncharacterized protein n=1 Tax=Brassica cretica TaxID=69181 RepID=A0A8S9N9E5_BRACR|nr:hypothetical protein F2Q69_00055186 [Brassica cretica]